jgi:hypothetical protein
MKKTRLLEIIREEISLAINEVPFPDGPLDISKSSDIAVSPGERDEVPLQDAIKDVVDVLKAEYPNLTNDDLAKLVTKVNSDKNRQADKDIKQKTADGETLEIAADSQIGKDYKAALNAIASAIEDQGKIYGGEDLPKDAAKKIDDLISQKGVDAKTVERLEKLKAKGYTYTLGFPQTLKAVERAVGGGTTKKTAKPKKEPTTTSEPKTTKVDSGDEGPSSADISSDETAKSLSSTPEEKKEKFNMGLRFIKKYKDDKPKIDAYLEKAKEEYKLTQSMLDDLKRAAGRGVE